MSDLVIKVKNLSKKYTIGQIHTNLLSERIGNGLRSFYNRIRDRNSSAFTSDLSQEKDFWALKDVSFGIEPGEVVGVIGRNGAGKSTLLKILSRITEPTEGQVELCGRVGSLLEVGTGFHPELTGRENIFLNGAILGMRKAEIRRKFDEIVAFAEVEKFIDTPVKRYSSGMYVRLAFAVAAHLEPDILIVDEVLAVGDAQFQKKCLGKMGDVAKHGRTVLFVSHNMEAVLRLCENTILIDNGSIRKNGATAKVISYYLKSKMGVSAIRRWDDKKTAPGNEIVRLVEVRVHTEDNKVQAYFDITKKIGITMDYEVLQAGHIFTHGCNFFNETGINILNSHDVVSDIRNSPREKGMYSSTVWIPANFLSEGVITVGVAILKPEPLRLHCHEVDVVSFTVTDNIAGNSARGSYVGNFPGIVRPILDWCTSKQIPEFKC